jgi:hypothetical protein
MVQTILQNNMRKICQGRRKTENTWLTTVLSMLQFTSPPQNKE